MSHVLELLVLAMPGFAFGFGFGPQGRSTTQGTAPSGFTAALKFNDARNSQYAGLV